MKLISEAEYESLLSRSLPPEKNEPLSEEEIASKILNDNISDDIKLALFMQLSHDISEKILATKNKVSPPSVLSQSAKVSTNVLTQVDANTENDDDKDSSESMEDYTNLIQRFPPKFQANAQIVVDLLAGRSDLIEWDASGKVTFFGTEKSNTNIFDLIGYLIRDLTWNTPPVGANRFLLICKKINVPVSVVRKALRSKFIPTLNDLGNVKSASDSVNLFQNLKSKLLNWSTVPDEEEEGSEEEMFDEAPLHTSSPKSD